MSRALFGTGRCDSLRPARLIAVVVLMASALAAGLTRDACAQITFRSAATAWAPVAGGPPKVGGVGTTAASGSGSIAPSVPTTAAPGDLLICVIESRDNFPATMPPGWNLLNQASGASGQHQATLFWKRAMRGETNPTISHSTSGGRIIAQIIAAKNVDMTSPFDIPNSFTASPADLTTEADAIATVTDTALVFTAHIAGPNTNSTNLPSGSQPWVRLGGASDGGVSDGVSVGIFRGFRAAGTQAALVYTHSDSAESHGAQIALRTASTLTISKPPGTQANDVMVASIAIASIVPSGQQPEITPPAGWSLVRLLISTNPAVGSSYPSVLAVYVKTAGPTEPSQYTWTIPLHPPLASAQGLAGGIQSFAGVDPSNPIDIESGQNSASSLSFSTPSITTSAPNAMLVASYSILSSANWTPPAGMTQAFEVASSQPPYRWGVAVEGIYLLQPSAGATGIQTATASNDANIGNAHILALRPASGQQAQASTMYYIHTDHLNSPRRIYNQAQQLVWLWENTEPFGDSVPNENPSGLGTFTCNLRFPGTYADTETGTLYNWHRTLAPALGRYHQSDPIGLGGGINTYAYVGGNPLSRIDPYGLRDVIVAIWTSRLAGYLYGGGSVGHVFVGELNGSPLLSQFPDPLGLEGRNTTLSWLDTVRKEGGRSPDYVYEVSVSKDSAFDAQIAALKAINTWYFWPDASTSTQCASAASTSLAAGGLKGVSRSNPSLPNYLNSELWIQSHFNSKVVRLPSAPW